jgi:hypothetical protein
MRVPLLWSALRGAALATDEPTRRHPRLVPAQPTRRRSCRGLFFGRLDSPAFPGCVRGVRPTSPESATLSRHDGLLTRRSCGSDHTGVDLRPTSSQSRPDPGGGEGSDGPSRRREQKARTEGARRCGPPSTGGAPKTLWLHQTGQVGTEPGHGIPGRDAGSQLQPSRARPLTLRPQAAAGARRGRCRPDRHSGHTTRPAGCGGS